MSGSGTDDPQAYSTPNTPRPKQTYSCDICGAKLSRHAHLQRHQKQHATSETESFACQLCDKRFTRKDVYQRHKRSVHGPAQIRRNGRKKSCHRCIRYKLRCSRELPCATCLDRRVQCTYDTNTKPLPPGHESRSSPLLEHPPRIDDGANWQPTLNDLASAANLIDESSQHTDDHLMAPIDPEPQRMQVDDALDTWDLLQEHVQHDGSTATTLNTQVPFSQFNTYDWDDILRSSRMDWLGCETEMSDDPTTHPLGNTQNQGTTPFSHSPQSELREANHLHTISTHSMQTHERQSLGLSAYAAPEIRTRPSCPAPTIISSPQADSSPANFSSSRDRENKETWPGVLDRGGNETWPFDYTSNKGFRKITLPPLREVLEQTVGHRPSIEKNTLHDLIKILSAPQIPSLNDTPALEALPAVAFLGEFVKIYFAEFHAVLPIIHIPTWRIEKCPTALLAAMACIGATYSPAEGSQEVAALLAEITQRALFWMGQQDSTAFRNSSYITASCFHQIFAVGTGNRRLYEIADSSRGLLVTSLRGLGILSSDVEQSEHFTFDHKELKKMDPPALEAAWLKWRDKEMEKRIAWSVFEFDCTLSVLTSKRGTFRIAELPSRLPCCEKVWEAHSAQAWAAILPFARTPPAGLPFYPLLQDVIAQKQVPSIAPAWAKRLCIHALGRMLYDLREIEDASASNVLGLSALTTAHQKTKQDLLEALVNLQDSLSQPTCTSEIVNMNIGSLSTHHAHLSNGHEAMDLVIYIFRNSGREASQQATRELDAAKDQLRFMFARDPQSARELAFHAASITGIARECTINTPCETMRVFFGYAFLLAFTKFFPLQQHQPNNITNPTTVQLDDIPWTRTPDAATQVQKWIDVGGRASLESVPNICDVRNFETLKQAALEAMRRLRVWGIAGKFHKTISNFG